MIIKKNLVDSGQPALLIGGSAKCNRVFAVGRKCPDCDTIISRYNKGPKCYIHGPKTYFFKIRPKKGG